MLYTLSEIQVQKPQHDCYASAMSPQAKNNKSEHLYSALHGTNHFKALAWIVSVHQMVPPLNVVADI